MPIFAEFKTGPIEIQHLQSAGNGVFPARAQEQSVHIAHSTCKNKIPELNVHQIGHWISSKNPPKYSVLFVNPLYGMKRENYDINIAAANTENKYVLFTDLTNGAVQNLVEYAMVFDGERIDAIGWSASHLITNDIVPIDTSKITCSLVWTPVPANTWMHAGWYIFRMKACETPHALVIHKTMPKSEEFPSGVVDSLRYGQSFVSQIDTFTPVCKEERKRPVTIGITGIRPCCQNFLTNGSLNEIPDEEISVQNITEKISLQNLIACL